MNTKNFEFIKINWLVVDEYANVLASFEKKEDCLDFIERKISLDSIYVYNNRSDILTYYVACNEHEIYYNANYFCVDCLANMFQDIT